MSAAPRQYDVAIVGAGILGLAHAYWLARAGQRVVVFDRDQVARGASVRNFGMLAIVAQSPGAQLGSARRTLEVWQDIARAADIHLDQAGCLFLARTPEEMAVLEEASAAADQSGHQLRLLSPQSLANHTDHIGPHRFLGGLFSPDAWKVDQRQALAKITRWLRDSHGVTFHFSTEVQKVSDGQITTTAGMFRAGHTILCGGDEFATLFPDAFRDIQISRCRLQMMRTVPQPAGWRLPPFLLGGLSLGRYGIFADCPSLPALLNVQRETQGTALEHGIHIVVAQETDGSITIGDSHAYSVAHGQDRSDEVDRLILAELAKLISLPNPQIADRWLGHYAYAPDGQTVRLHPDKDVTAVTMTNGQGMTHCFAEAEATVAGLIG